MEIITNNSRMVNYQKGENFIFEGDIPENIKIIKSGFVKVYGVHLDGKQSILQILGKNQTIMESSLLLNSTYHANVEAIEKIELIVIDKTAFNFFLDADVRNLQTFMNISLIQYQQLLDKMGVIQIKSAIDRIAWFLLTHYIENNDRNNLNVQLPFDKVIIASYLNMTPETLSRSMKKLKQRGCNVDKNIITLPAENFLCEHCTENLMSKCIKSKLNENYCPKNYR